MFHWAGRCKNNHFFKWLFFCIFVFMNSKNVWDKDVDEKREKKIIVSSKINYSFLNTAS